MNSQQMTAQPDAPDERPPVDPLAQALLDRCLSTAGYEKLDGALPNDPLTCGEVRAMAQVVQRGADMAAHLDRANATLDALSGQFQNMRIAMRLLRFYALNPVILPDQDQVVAYLRAWIDDGRWLPMEWPTELPTAAKFLADMGCINFGGLVVLAGGGK